MRSTLFAALAAGAAVAAQSIITVNVGGNSSDPTIYTPNSFAAPNDTVVSFQFTGIPGNHTVTQSSFANPCEPLPNGFDSGWVFVNETLATPPIWNLTITNDQAPIWFFCKQTARKAHCPAGMVGVINVQPGAKSFQAFQASAAAASTVGQAEGGFSGVGAFATGAPVIASGATLFNPSASATAPSGPVSSSHSGAPGASQTPKGSALSTGVSSLPVLLTTLFGMALVL